MSLFCCSEKLQTHSIWTFSLFLKNKWIQASLHFLQKCTLVALYIIKASFSGEACCFNTSNDDIFPFFVLGTGKSLTTFTISGSVLAAAARSRHVCCICSVVCILACSASRWASGVWGCGEHRTDVRTSSLASLAGFPHLADLPNKHLPESERQPANVLLCLERTSRFSVAGSNPKPET